MVPSQIFQHTPIYIQQPTFVPNQHRMPNSNQQPQQFVQPIQYTNYSTNQQPLPYMNQSYQSSTYPQTNQPHQPVATQHVTQTQPQNNPYPQPPAQQHPQMLVQNTTLQQREKKIISITDPITGKSLNGELQTNRMPSPSVSSANQGEEVKEQTAETADERKNKVCQEFAKKVAACFRADPQNNQNEDSKSEDISKEEATIEVSEDPQIEIEKLEETEETTEKVNNQSEETQEEPKPVEESTESTIDEKAEKEVSEEKLPESDDKDSKFYYSVIWKYFFNVYI